MNRQEVGPATPRGAALAVSDLRVTFPTSEGEVTAVRGVSFEVAKGEVLSIVGESGAGKSVTALAVMGLLPAHARVDGSVRLHHQQLLNLDDKRLSKLRGAAISMVFQDPLSSLTPVYSVGDQLAEAVLVHNHVSKEQARRRAVELLELVGIPRPAQRADAFPHEFSGGMRQRVMIAMAIANCPEVIICDEPTTALDVTIQAQVLGDC